MKLLFDLNVLIDVAARWQKFPESYAAYNALLERADHAICLPACGYTTLYYVLAKLLSEEQARQTVRRFTDVMGVTPFDDKTVRLAHQLDFTDFEDAAVAASAVAGRCDRIITRNVQDFSRSPVRAVTPVQLLSELS